VLVSTTPPMPGRQVRLRALDVDDPTPYSEDGGYVVDANDNLAGGTPRGGDNRGTPAAGTLAATLLTLDGQGKAQTDLTLPMQPGDNLRVAAVFEQPGATNHLNALQVTNPAAPLYLAASNNAVLRFRGGVSPLLTVWRRLNVEVDSMQMWTGNKPAPDRSVPTGTGFRWPPQKRPVAQANAARGGGILRQWQDEAGLGCSRCRRQFAAVSGGE
jgi:hypothetical protein